MSETKFPEVEELEWGVYGYDNTKVSEWLKRCIEDAPKWVDVEWFDKWFSQFKGESS